VQKLILLRPSGDGYTAQTVWGPAEVASPHVVFISSMPSLDDTERRQFPAFILERLEDEAPTAFFEEDGELRSRSWTN
jgi:hypothetical protein